MNINRNIELAIRAAHSGYHKRYRVGAILVKSGNVISVGSNSYRTDPKMGDLKPLHAEVAALIGVRYRDLSRSTIFVARINRSEGIGMAKPCPICSGILKDYGVKKAYYTNKLGLVDCVDL